MSSNFRIAFRFLTAKKRAMLMSLSCTVLGVGLFIVTQGTTSGFEVFFIRTLLGTDGAMRVEDRFQDTLRSMEAAGGSQFQIGQKEGLKYIEGVEEPKLLTEAILKFANVRAVSAVLKGNVQIASALKTRDVQLFGVDIDRHIEVSDLEEQIVVPKTPRGQGDLDPFRRSPSGALIGRVIADDLQLDLNDWFVVNARGQSHRYRVAGIYETGVRDIDKTRIYIDLIEARSLLKKPTGASYLQISLRDPSRAPAEAAQMERVLSHRVAPWQKREEVWLGVFRALRVSSGITVLVFTLIASLAMFNTLAMIAMEKTKDIAILRSMGYERRDITQIFLWQAGIVLAIGAVFGALFGAVVTYGVSRVPLSINTIFKTDTFQVHSEPAHYIQAIGTALVMVMIASLVPARRAARLEPGDVVRGTAQ
jgi:lipoprotein-releasing system permease protein